MRIEKYWYVILFIIFFTLHPFHPQRKSVPLNWSHDLMLPLQKLGYVLEIRIKNYELCNMPWNLNGQNFFFFFSPAIYSIMQNKIIKKTRLIMYGQHSGWYINFVSLTHVVFRNWKWFIARNLWWSFTWEEFFSFVKLIRILGDFFKYCYTWLLLILYKIL